MRISDAQPGCCRFQDSRGWCCAAYNEVAIDYNAAFTGAVARLVDFYDNMTPFSDCTLDLGWTHPNATLVRSTWLLCVKMCSSQSIWSTLGYDVNYTVVVSLTQDPQYPTCSFVTCSQC